VRPQSLVLILLLVFATAPAASQEAAGAAAACDYESCALNVMPTWNGLAIVRGVAEERIAVLGFFRPGTIQRAFGGSPAAIAMAERAMRTRRRGAVLTDAGAALILGGAVLAINDGRVGRASGALLAVGVVGVGVSVPLQFAADGQLSRAVWLFNRQFARP
jgi:hypothetical protein